MTSVTQTNHTDVVTTLVTKTRKDKLVTQTNDIHHTDSPYRLRDNTSHEDSKG